MRDATDAPFECLLVRHAEVAGHDLRLWGRTIGVELSAGGQRQVASLARALADVRIDAVYTGPCARTWETARIVAAFHDVPLECDPAFDELDFGEWTGHSFDDLEHDPRWHEFNAARASAVAPGGEAVPAFESRVIEGFATLRARHAHGMALVVTHAEVIRMILLHALGLTVDAWQRLRIDPGSLSAVRCDRADHRVSAINLDSAAVADWAPTALPPRVALRHFAVGATGHVPPS